MRLPPTLAWKGDARRGHLELLDQTLLPGTIRVLRIRTVDALVEAIRRLSVRGAPALGVAGAYGVVLAAQGSLRDRGASHAHRRTSALAVRVRQARPTAVNLALGVDRALAEWAAATFLLHGSRADAAEAALRAAKRMHREDQDACRAMGRFGAPFLREGGTYITHCNTGALATAGTGTAFAVFAEGKRLGRRFTVLADETRPLLQGARLTALELKANGIPGRLIPDGAAGGLLARGLVHGAFVGADRIAANGDFANKVGTYPLAVLCREHGVPFYCVAPTTTVDPGTPDGARIPIEERDHDEVREFGGRLVAPRGFPVINPAFDVTPARLVTALITERGVLRRPTAKSLAAHLA